MVLQGTFLPYRIHHIELNSPVREIENALSSNEPRYFVFWWKCIALGHLYLEQGMVAHTEFLQKTITAITPAIHHYSKRSESQSMEWASFFIRGDETAFSGFMENILGVYREEGQKVTLPLSVIICTRNRPDQLKKCLDSLNSMSHKPAQIVVVDNDPANASAFDIVQGIPGITYCKEPRQGLDRARNTGLRHATFSIIAFTDDDVLVHKNWLSHVWKTFSDPGVMAMTGLVITASLQTESQFIFEKYWSFNRGYIDKIYDDAFFTGTLKKGPPVWEIGAGANMAFRREVFDKLGYFDERLGAGASGCSDDSEMWFRILASHGLISYNPRAIVYHEHRTSLSSLKTQLYNYMRGFTAACLIQQEALKKARYRHHLLWVLPRYYLHLIRHGFPRYRLRYATIFTEIRGMISGWIFFFRNRKKPAFTQKDE